jgi:hypothetical protein
MQLTRMLRSKSPPHLDSASAFLQTLNAELLEHDVRRTLHDYMSAVRETLRRWSAPAWVSDAGLLHCIYGSPTSPKELFPIERREEVRERIGKDAEQLIYFFRTVPHERFFTESDANAAAQENIERKYFHAMLLLLLAVEAQAVSERFVEPYLRLSNMSRSAARLPESDLPVPTFFASCTAIVSPEEEKQFRALYAEGLGKMHYDAADADRLFSLASIACPWIAEPIIWRAHLAARAGNHADAASFLNAAEKTLERFGTAWDTRLCYDDWHAFINMLRLRSADDLSEDIFASIRSAASKQPIALHKRHEETTLPPRFIRYMESFADNHEEPRMNVYPDLSTHATYDQNFFPIVNLLESHFHDIRNEILSIDERFFQEVFFLYERGRKNEDHCALCPITTYLIESDNIAGHAASGRIYFSKLKPNTHVNAHHGTTNMHVRCHLALQIPKGDCGLRAGDAKLGWMEGKCLVFNDFIEHEVWNNSLDERIVLVLDLWHPDLSPREIEFLDGLHRYVNANGRR